MFDIILSGNTVYDGLNTPPVKTDIGIVGDKIISIGNLKDSPTKKLLQFPNHIICPGFIDMHSHSDVYYLADPLAECKIRQGVTTEVVGNCGVSAAPLYGAFKERRATAWKQFGIDVTWQTFPEYIDCLKKIKPSINIIPLVGHGNIRAMVKGYSNEKLTNAEKKKAIKILEELMEQGAYGMSTGLIYQPSMYANTEEIIELAKVVAQYNGIYTSHIRGEGDSVIESIKEVIEIAKKANVNTQISHLKAGEKRNWKKIDQIFTMIETAIAEGVQISCDRYPYIASNTDLDVIFPDNAPTLSKKTLINHLNKTMDDDWAENIMIGKTKTEKNKWTQGLTIEEISKQKKLSPEETVVDLLFEEEFSVSAMFFGMCEENLLRILKKPYTMIGSDSSLRKTEGILAQGHPHPRVFGTFPRVLKRYVGKNKLSLQEAIYKMTGLPAKKLNLKNRGTITKDSYADIVIINPETVTDTATYKNPFQYPKGIDMVIAEGKPYSL